MRYTDQQIAKALGYTKVRLTDRPGGYGRLHGIVWKVPRRDGKTGKGIYRETIDKLPVWTSEQIAKAEEVLKKDLCKGQSTYVNKGVGTAVPCGNKVWRDGYCKTHHPGEEKANEAKKWERWEKKWAAERLAQAKNVSRDEFAEARKAAGLLTIKEARALGAKI